MNYKLKEKNFLWVVTGSFASKNFTTIGKTIYHPPGLLPGPRMIKHEKVHIRQQKETGLLKYILLYVFAFPFVWNPWRYKWELEAYLEDGTSKEKAMEIISSKKYGWLRNK